MNLRKLNVEASTINSRILHYLFILFCHSTVIYLIVAGEFKNLFIAYLMSLPLTHIGVSFTYHRVLTHNAVKLPKWFVNLLTLYAGMSAQGSGLSWVTVHNAHHRYSGEDKDPHSPKHAHWVWIQLLGYTFRRVSGKHAGRLLKDKFQVWLHNHYWKVYGPIFLALGVLLPLETAITYVFAPVAITWQLQSLANTWGHKWGTNDDQPYNSWFMFPFILGDAWHKNHHDKPGAVRFHKYDVIGAIAEWLFVCKPKKKKIKYRHWLD